MQLYKSWSLVSFAMSCLNGIFACSKTACFTYPVPHTINAGALVEVGEVLLSPASKLIHLLVTQAIFSNVSKV